MMPFYPLMMILLMNAMQVAATNSTMIPGHQLEDEGFFGKSHSLKVSEKNVLPFGDFFISKKNMVEINCQLYEISGLLSKSNFGSVYKATLDGTTKVAIKVINNASKKSENYERAKKEIFFLEKLKKSKNVVNILTWEVSGSTVAIVMEYCTSSLFDWMIEKKVFGNGPSSEKVIDDFVPFLSSAVQQMRSQKIVHFDLKPENILRCGNVWKVANFDSAEFVRDEQAVSFRGSHGYTDPAVVQKKGGIATLTTDLYSVGAILYALVTGEKYDIRPEAPKLPVELNGLSQYGALGSFIQQLLNKKFDLKNFYHFVNLFLFNSFDISFKTSMVKINGQRYRIVRFIQKGGFGSVHEAINGSGKKVAIKLITPTGTEKRKQLFLGRAGNEIIFLKNLKESNNFVTILNSEVKDSSAAIVMEYCTASLFDWMIEKKVFKNGLSSEQVIEDFVPFLSSAVQQMRAQKIVHFDLKPGNILQCDGEWKVADLDAAVFIEEGKTRQVSRRGTDGYTDPEVTQKGGGVATPTTDLYSVGAILYELVTGEKYDIRRGLPVPTVGLEGAFREFIQQLLKKNLNLKDFYYYANQLDK